MEIVLGVTGAIVTIAGICWTIVGIRSNGTIKRQLLNEREMLRQKVLDFKSRIESHENKILTDRKNQNDPSLNTIHIRVEEVTALRSDLERFATMLEKDL